MAVIICGILNSYVKVVRRKLNQGPNTTAKEHLRVLNIGVMTVLRSKKDNRIELYEYNHNTETFRLVDIFEFTDR